MMRLNRMASDRFCVLPNTLDPLYPALERITIDRRTLGLPTGRMLLSVARLAASERYKNIQHVITSLPTVLLRIPDAFYVIVGDGCERKRLEDLASTLGLDKK